MGTFNSPVQMDDESMLDDCQATLNCSNHPFTPWEEDFIGSIQEWWDDHDELTERQGEVLGDIWEKI